MNVISLVLWAAIAAQPILSMPQHCYDFAMNDDSFQSCMVSEAGYSFVMNRGRGQQRERSWIFDGGGYPHCWFSHDGTRYACGREPSLPMPKELQHETVWMIERASL